MNEAVGMGELNGHLSQRNWEWGLIEFPPAMLKYGTASTERYKRAGLRP